MSRPTAPAVDKVVLTNRGALEAKYGRRLGAVDDAFAGLVDADRGRGLKTMVLAVDDVAAMERLGGRAVTDPADAAQCKAAVDAVHHRLAPDYLLLVGSTDVVPHQPLRNPVHDGVNDVDELAPSDLPYACNAPFSEDPTNFIGPDRVVGRLPDVTGAKDPAVLIKLLQAAASWTSRPRSDFEDHLGITAKAWEGSTALSLGKLFGAAEIHTSPAEGPAWTAARLQRRIHFINCHGAEGDPQFYGQHGTDYPVSLRSADVTGHVAAGTVVAAECCYGAQLWAAGPGDGEPLAMAYIGDGAAAFFGSTTIAYGPANANGDADLICEYFLEGVLAGASLGRAALEARQRFVHGDTVLSPVSTKTLAQFQLLGDPSVCPVLAAGPARGQRAATSARRARRARLLEHAIANLRDTSTTTPAAATDRAVPPVPMAADLDVLADLPPLAATSVKLFSVAPPPLAGVLPPPPQAALDAEARIRVVLGRSLTQPTSRVTRSVAPPAGLTDITAVEVREQDGRIVTRRVLSSR